MAGSVDTSGAPRKHGAMSGTLATTPAAPTRLVRCACLALISNSDHARCLLFPTPHPAWPAPRSPIGYLISDLADASQAALCGAALHVAGQLGKDPQLVPNPDWREDDWLDEARCSHQAHHGETLLLPRAFIHLSSVAGRGSWPKARSKFTALAEALLGPCAMALDGEKAYRDESYWGRVRLAACSLDEKASMASISLGKLGPNDGRL